MESLLDVLKRNLNTNIYIAAKNALGQLRAKEDSPDPLSGNSLNPIDSLNSMISKKSDISDMRSLENLKANKSDLKSIHIFAHQINDNMKYILTMIIELVDILNTSSKESKTEKTIKLSRLAYQLTLIYKSMISREDFIKTYGNDMSKIIGKNRLLDSNKITRQGIPSIVIRSSPKRLEISRTNLSKYFKTDIGKNNAKHNLTQAFDNSLTNNLKALIRKDFVTPTNQNKIGRAHV